MDTLEKKFTIGFFSVMGFSVLLLAADITVNAVIDWREHQQYMQSQVCEASHDETVLQP